MARYSTKKDEESLERGRTGRRFALLLIGASLFFAFLLWRGL